MRYTITYILAYTIMIYYYVHRKDSYIKQIKVFLAIIFLSSCRRMNFLIISTIKKRVFIHI